MNLNDMRSEYAGQGVYGNRFGDETEIAAAEMREELDADGYWEDDEDSEDGNEDDTEA